MTDSQSIGGTRLSCILGVPLAAGAKTPVAPDEGSRPHQEPDRGSRGNFPN
jgi:hypothetical protein